ncbi:MAG: sodium:proton antiporter [Anaerolineae bacterium]|nr:sodium:proton antiporter [Anaerolineae bacterium]
MEEHILIGLTGIAVLGIGAQWLAWRLNLPSILLLLVFGFLAGPVTGFLHPDELLGEVLFPLVSLSVAVILFEGGLSLKLSDLRQAGRAVRNLVSIGILITWVLGAVAAYFILDLSPALAVLLGAILVVTGPTVTVPLLRHIRPVGKAGLVAKWEGIVNDPIGAILAVLVFEAIVIGGLQEATASVAAGLLLTVIIGGVGGVLGGGLIVLLLKRFWIPDFLQNAFALMIVLTAFTVSNVFQAESGLLTVTVIGIVLANQKEVMIRHIVEFKENLRVLLISALFILLAARLQLSDLTILGLGSLIFLAVLTVIVRPVAVFFSTIGSELNWRERIFIAWLAPRGIVAAAVASLFSLRLVEAGNTQAERLVPIVFLVIAGTVAIYGLTLSPLARWLKISDANPQGVLIVGAHEWARAIGKALQEAGFPVLLVDPDRRAISEARLAGLPTFEASIMSEYTLDAIDLGGIGRLLALTSNQAINTLATSHFAHIFGRAEVYQLPEAKAPGDPQEAVSQHLGGRTLFSAISTFDYLNQRFQNGAEVKTTDLNDTFNFDDFRDYYNGTALPLFLIDETGALNVFNEDNPPLPEPGHTLISLVEPISEEGPRNSVPNYEKAPSW